MQLGNEKASRYAPHEIALISAGKARTSEICNIPINNIVILIPFCTLFALMGSYIILILQTNCSHSLLLGPENTNVRLRNFSLFDADMVGYQYIQ